MPDIALEETGQVRDVASKYGLELVLLSTPTTRPERAEAIAKVTQGFLYLVSVAGEAPLVTAYTACFCKILLKDRLTVRFRKNRASQDAWRQLLLRNSCCSQWIDHGP